MFFLFRTLLIVTHGFQKHLDHDLIKKLSGLFLYVGPCGRFSPGRPEGASGNKRVMHVHHREIAGGKGVLFAAQAIWITASIPALVVKAWKIQGRCQILDRSK